MTVAQELKFLALRPLINAATQSVQGDGDSESVAGLLGRYLGSHAEALAAGLDAAAARAWTAAAVVLAGPEWWQRCEQEADVAADADLRQHVGDFLRAEPVPDAAARDPGFRRDCLEQLEAARQAGALTGGPPDWQELLRRPASFFRRAEAGTLVEEEAQAVRRMAEELRRRGYPALAGLLPDDGRVPLPVTAVRFFLAWQVGRDPALAGPLPGPPSAGLAEPRAAAWRDLAAALERHGPELEALLRAEGMTWAEGSRAAQVMPTPRRPDERRAERLDREAVQALAARAATATAPAGAPVRSRRTQEIRRRWQVWSTLVLAVALALATAGIYVVWRGSMPAEVPQAPGLQRVIPPAGTAEKPTPLTPGEMAQALADLRSADPGRRRAAAARLAETPVDDRQGDVVRELDRLAQDQDLGVRKAAVAALGRWGTRASVPVLVGLTRDYNGEVRWAAVQALGHIQDGRGAEAVALRLKDPGDRAVAARALRAMGRAAEKAVQGLLSDPDPGVRREAAGLLEQIGTKVSVPALEKARSDKDEGVRRAAEAALKAVRAKR